MRVTRSREGASERAGEGEKEGGAIKASGAKAEYDLVGHLF